MMHPIDEIDLADAIADERNERLHRQALLRHPDCRDPEHPGCEQCDDADEGEGGDE